MTNDSGIESAFKSPASYRDDDQLPAKSAMLEELLKATPIQQLFESYYKLLDISIAIIDLRGNVLLSSPWRRMCAQFHRAKPTPCGPCLESDTKLATHLQEGKNYTIHSCLNGLTSCAAPIIVERDHIANIILGQFLTQAPDEVGFRLQAEQVGFDVGDYLVALREVPIIPAERIPAILDTLVCMTRVITTLGADRKRALECEGRQSAILDTIPQAVFWKDLQGRYLGCNTSFARAAGLATSKDIIGKTDAALPWPREGAESHRADDLAVISSNQPRLHIVKDVHQADGSRMVIDISKIPLVDASNTLYGIASICEDITEQKRTERNLRKAETYRRMLFESARDAIVILKNERCIDCNPAALALFRTDRKSFVGDVSLFESFSPPYQPDGGLSKESGRAKVSAGYTGISQLFEWQYQRADGTLFEAEVSLSRAMFNGDEVLLQAIIREISERKQAEEALRESEARFKEAERLALLGSSSWDVESDTTVWSDELYRIAGRDPQQPAPTYQERAAIYTPESWVRLESAVQRTFETGEPYDLELDVVRPDGTLRRTHARGAAVRGDGGRIVRLHGTLQDITESKVAQLRLEQQVVFNGIMTRILTRFATCTARDIDDGIAAALRSIAEFVGVDHAVIIAISEDGTTWSLTHEWCAAHVTPAMLRHQAMPLGTLPFTERQILMGDAVRLNTVDDLPPQAVEDRRHQVTEGYLSRLGVPFRTKSGMQGSIGLLSHAREVTWSDEDVGRLRVLGGAIAGVLERKLVANNQLKLLERNHAYLALLDTQQHLANEIAQAAEYVVSLLPAPISIGEVKTVWRYAPSATLGGDSFGYHWIDENHFAFYLLDVCGHGVGSALLSVSALNVLRAQSLPDVDFRDPVAVLGGMNASFQMKWQNGLYFTLWYGVYNRQTRRLRHASAGHPPALLVAESPPVRQLNSTNFFIGVFPKVNYQAAEIDIQPNSRLYLFSDGVYEVDRPDGTMWSFEQLQDFLSRQPSESGAEIDKLYKLLQEMHSSDVLDDDFSLLRVDFNRESAPTK